MKRETKDAAQSASRDSAEPVSELTTNRLSVYLRCLNALDASGGVRIGPSLSIVSVGEATRADDRSVRIPLVLGDDEGGTSTVVLTVRIDPLLSESGD